jgi:hypothetical protein
MQVLIYRREAKDAQSLNKSLRSLRLCAANYISFVPWRLGVLASWRFRLVADTVEKSPLPEGKGAEVGGDDLAAWSLSSL